MPPTAALKGARAIVCCFALISAGVGTNDRVTVAGIPIVGNDTHVGAYSTPLGHVDIIGVTVGKPVYVGSGTTALPKLKIGHGATGGAVEVIVRSVAAGITMYAKKWLRKTEQRNKPRFSISEPVTFPLSTKETRKYESSYEEIDGIVG